MIYNLRKKFILISTLSVVIVFSLIFLLICLVGSSQLNNTMDTLTDAISSNDGVFPDFNSNKIPRPDGRFPQMDFITKETQFSTRFFTVWLDEDDNIVKENIDSVSSVTRAQARQYTKQALSKENERGWISEYRYRVYRSEYGTSVVFVNGKMNRAMTNRLLVSAMLILLGSGLVIILLIVIISKRAVKPAAESYEKQKQFITDANHELKTPLTLILTNLDIAESELGKNEWLDDIRSEGERMSALVNQLTALSRMDEDQTVLSASPFDLSSTASDTISEFEPLAEEKGKALFASVEPSISYTGDEGMIRRLISILLDNAVKYCDPGGEISICVYAKRHPVITVENTYCDVEQVELNRLFDRFYRADKARTFSGSFGIGLSIAAAIAKSHHGEVTAYKKDRTHIGFKVTLK